MKCKACKQTISPFFSLGQMPLVNSFLTKKELKSEKMYDLTVAFCSHCYLVQLVNTVPPEELFSHYLYFSSTSASFLEHCKKTAANLSKRFKLDSDSLVMEIASNDGAQLQYFKQLGIPIIGVDPAKNIAKLASERGIPTIPDFFSQSFAKKYLDDKKQKPNLIFGANVLAHVPEIVDFLKGVKLILAEDGTAVFEFPYLKGLLENKFDTIYHEHVFYYSLIALINVFTVAGLTIYDVEQTHTQGGSLRIFACHDTKFSITSRLLSLQKAELKAGYDTLETYKKMSTSVMKLRTQLLKLLDKIKNEGKTIAAYSAPAKGNILLNYFGIGSDYLEYIVDKAEAKQGLYTPGTHLLVHPVEKVLESQPDYLLILCWNLADEVAAQQAEYKKRGGKFIIPVPQLRIL